MFDTLGRMAILTGLLVIGGASSLGLAARLNLCPGPAVGSNSLPRPRRLRKPLVSFISKGRAAGPSTARLRVVAAAATAAAEEPKPKGRPWGRAPPSSITDGAEPLTPREARSVLVLLLASFLNLLGFTMAGPITPSLGAHFGLEIGASFGALTSAYPLGMLLGLAVWPRLSDRVGRKPVIVGSLVGSSAGLLAQAAAVAVGAPLEGFLALRVLTGVFAGSSPVAKAYLADVGGAVGRLPTYMAWRDAAGTLAFIVGPALGGLVCGLGGGGGGGAAAGRAMGAGAVAGATTGTAGFAAAASSLATVIGTAAAGSAAAALCVALFLKPPLAAAAAAAPERKSATEEAGAAVPPPRDGDEVGTGVKGVEKRAGGFDEGQQVSCPMGRELWSGVASVCAVSTLFNVGASTFDAFFAPLAATALGLTPQRLGVLYTSLAALSFLVSTNLSARAISRLGPVAACALGLAACAAGLSGLGTVAAAAAGGAGLSSLTSLQSAALFLLAAATYQCGVPLYGPTVPTMLLRCVPPSRRGAVMGLDGGVKTLARVLSPLFFGRLYATQGPGPCFRLAGGVVAAAACLALLRRGLVLRAHRKVDEAIDAR